MAGYLIMSLWGVIQNRGSAYASPLPVVYRPFGTLERMILVKNLHALIKWLVLMVLDERGADAEALLMAACSDKADGRDTII